MTERGPTNMAAVGTWLAVGIGVGVAIGVATDNLAVWIAIGAVVGVAIGVVIATVTDQRSS